MGKINKKIKKTLNMYPVVSNQPHYPSGYDGRSTPKRRKQLAEFISDDGTFLPKSVLHEDLDLGLLEFVKDRLRITVNGKAISFVDQILTLQRWAEFADTWSFSDKDLNPKIPFLVVVRQPDVQYGTNPALIYTIPDRRTFHYSKVPTWDGQRKGMDLYKIPQPVPIDITYDLKIVCNRMRELNLFNKVIMQTFTSRQAYTFVKGHYIPIVLTNISDESQMSDLEKRKFYSQNYTLQLQGFLIDEEEFIVTPAITRKIALFEVGTKTRKKQMEPVGDNDGNFVEDMIFTLGTGLSITKTFEYDATIQILELKEIASYTISVNGTNLSNGIEQFYITNGDVVVFTVCCLTVDSGYPKTLVLGTHLA